MWHNRNAMSYCWACMHASIHICASLAEPCWNLWRVIAATVNVFWCMRMCSWDTLRDTHYFMQCYFLCSCSSSGQLEVPSEFLCLLWYWDYRAYVMHSWLYDGCWFVNSVFIDYFNTLLSILLKCCFKLFKYQYLLLVDFVYI